MTLQEFTGERFIPGAGGWQLAYEHLHRYLFAARWAEGKSVLDVAAGEGYGAAMLARKARHVCAMDIDGPAVVQARSVHGCGKLSFLQADATRIPLRSGSVEFLVALEVLEHVAGQEDLIREIARVLSPRGIALISTPDKAVYSEARQYTNPFHVHELHRGEFESLLRKHFPHIQMMDQQVRAGSLITLESKSGVNNEILAQPPPGSELRAAQPMYLLALCSVGEAVESIPANSAFLDSADALLKEWIGRIEAANREIGRLNEEIQRVGEWGKELEGQLLMRDESLRLSILRSEQELALRDHNIIIINELMQREIAGRDSRIRDLQSRIEDEIRVRDAGIRELQTRMHLEIDSRDGIIGGLQSQMQQEINSRDGTIGELQRQMEEEIRHRDQTAAGLLQAISDLEKEFEERTRWALSLQEEVSKRDACIKRTTDLLEQTDAELKRVEERLAAARHAFLYRVLSRLGLLPR